MKNTYTNERTIKITKILISSLQKEGLEFFFCEIFLFCLRNKVIFWINTLFDVEAIWTNDFEALIKSAFLWFQKQILLFDEMPFKLRQTELLQEMLFLFVDKFTFFTISRCWTYYLLLFSNAKIKREVLFTS